MANPGDSTRSNPNEAVNHNLHMLTFSLRLSSNPYCGAVVLEEGFSLTSSVYQAIIRQVTDNATFPGDSFRLAQKLAENVFEMTPKSGVTFAIGQK
jgi:hypothetical protein